MFQQFSSKIESAYYMYMYVLFWALGRIFSLILSRTSQVATTRAKDRRGKQPEHVAFSHVVQVVITRAETAKIEHGKYCITCTTRITKHNILLIKVF